MLKFLTSLCCNCADVAANAVEPAVEQIPAIDVEAWGWRHRRRVMSASCSGRNDGLLSGNRRGTIEVLNIAIIKKLLRKT